LKDENSDEFVNSHNVLKRWKNWFCQILNAQGVNDIRQPKIHTAEH